MARSINIKMQAHIESNSPIFRADPWNNSWHLQMQREDLEICGDELQYNQNQQG